MRGKLRIRTEQIECDYYDWCQGKLYAINQYRGEYMTQYSWAEFTNGELDRQKIIKKENGTWSQKSEKIFDSFLYTILCVIVP